MISSSAVEPIAVFVFALTVRLILFPYWQELPLSGDEIYYWSSAKVIADGSLTRNFLHPPIWTYLLGIPAWLFDDHVYGRLMAAVISSFSVPVVYLLGKHLFDKKSGIIAGVLYAVYPNVVGFSHYLWSETLLSLLVLISTLFFIKSLGNEQKRGLLYMAVFIISLGLLVKEFAVIHFGAVVIVLWSLDIKQKRQVILRCFVIFLAPAVIYSIYASTMAGRPVLLADAFVYNSNEADAGKKTWEKSTKENLEIFVGRISQIKKMPERLIEQIHNLWTPTSFPVFRLLHSQERYNNVPYAGVTAYAAGGMYVFVMILGLTGMVCTVNKTFQVFAAANILLLLSTGLLFLMCSRFRIPYMYIFILFTSFVVSSPKAVLSRLTIRRAVPLGIFLIIFAEVIISGRHSFGYWG